MYNFELKEFIYAERQSGEYVAPHFHNYYEIIYFQNGEGIASINQNNYHYTTDTLQIISPYTLHKDVSYITTTVRCCIFSCTKNLFLTNMTIFKNENNKKYFENILKQIIILENLFKHRSKNLNNTKKEKKMRLLYDNHPTSEHILSLLLINLTHLAEKIKINSAFDADLVTCVKNFIEKNFNYNINFEVLSEQVGYSYERLRHLFVEKTKISLKKYQLSIRLVHAKTYLTETNLKIKQISKKCGFTSNVRFAIFFKKATQMSPLTYRRYMQTILNQPSSLVSKLD